MNETEGIFELLPEGMFANSSELQSVIDESGLESIYPLLPEGMFVDEQDFLSQYSLKKKRRYGIRIGSWFIGACRY
jgi:hypothetical protein